MHKVVYTKKATKDIRKIKESGLSERVQTLILLIKEDPFQTPPSFEKLVGDLQGAYSRKINIKHRLVYQVFSKEKIVKILSMWSHYEF